MRFIETNEGFVNLQHVARIVGGAPNPAGVQRSLFKDTNDKVLDVMTGEIYQHHLSPVVAALPGFSVIHVDVDGDNIVTWEDDIIAFAVSVESSWPITVDGYASVHGYEYWGVKQPNGKIIQPGGGSFDTTEAFVKCVVHIDNARKKP